jgi:hypothetical protein
MEPEPAVPIKCASQATPESTQLESRSYGFAST